MRPLQLRVAKLGFSDMELWQTLSWIRELCPLIVHLNLDKVRENLHIEDENVNSEAKLQY